MVHDPRQHSEKALLLQHTAMSGIQGSIYISTASGFNYVVAAHDRDLDKSLIAAILIGHISHLVGGNFYTHFSGRSGEPVPQEDQHAGNGSLLDYEKELRGFLNFFQLNVIIEGIYNSNFIPNIYFSERKDLKKARSDLSKFSLGKFFSMISVEINVEGGGGWLAGRILNLLSQFADSDTAEFYEHICSPTANDHVSTRFLESTGHKCFKDIKIVIERCRRVLLGQMLEVTQRRRPIVQAESPSGEENELYKENEAQIRGFVMLLSAKLPLLNNVKDHLQEYVEERTQSLQMDDNRFTPLQKAYRTWDRLLKSIIDNVREIEKAIHQSRIDQTLYEQSQMRADQETKFELDRIQLKHGARLGTPNDSKSKPGADHPWATIGLTIISVIVAAIGLPRVPPNFAAFAGVLIVLLIIFAAVSAERHRHARKLHKEYLRKATTGHTNYEFDFHLDATLFNPDPEIVGADERFAELLQEGELKELVDIRKSSKAGAVGNIDGSIIRGVFPQGIRNDRASVDEEIKKIHLEVEISWAVDHLGKILNGNELGEITSIVTIIYELLVHKPSRNRHFVLRDVRAIALQRVPLSYNAIELLEEAIVKNCVNVLLSEQDQIDIIIDRSRKSEALSPR